MLGSAANSSTTIAKEKDIWKVIVEHVKKIWSKKKRKQYSDQSSVTIDSLDNEGDFFSVNTCTNYLVET